MTPPRLLLIADGFARDANVREHTLASVAAGVPWVQLRDYEVDVREFALRARKLCEDLRDVQSQVVVSVSTHADLARDLGAGLHVGRRGPSIDEARRVMGDGLLTAAAHSVEDGLQAAAQGVDAVVFGPVFRTPSKPSLPGAGVAPLADVVAAVSPVPVIALGGINPERVPDCLAAGAHGIAVVSSILGAPEAAIPAIVSAFLTKLGAHDQK